jgi:hypothetical protein
MVNKALINTSGRQTSKVSFPAINQIAENKREWIQDIVQDKDRSRRKKGGKTPAPTYLTNLGLSKINASVPKISPYRAVRLHITETKDFFCPPRQTH